MQKFASKPPKTYDILSADTQPKSATFTSSSMSWKLDYFLSIVCNVSQRLILWRPNSLEWDTNFSSNITESNPVPVQRKSVNVGYGNNRHVFSAHFSPRRPGFNPRPVHAGRMVDEVTLDALFSEYCSIPVGIISPMPHSHPFIYHRHSLILANDSIFK